MKKGNPVVFSWIPFLIWCLLISLSALITVFVKCRIKGIKVSCIQIFLSDSEAFPETLEVNNFPFSQKLDGVSDIRIIGKSQDIIVCRACFLLGRQIFSQICNDIAFYSNISSCKRDSGCCHWIHTRRVINKIGVKSRFTDLLLCQIPGQLMDDSTDHFHVCQFFSTYRSIGNAPITRLSQWYISILAVTSKEIPLYDRDH